MKSKTRLLWLSVIVLTTVILVPFHAANASGVCPGRARAAGQLGFDPVFTITGTMSPGVLGLPGEPVTWTITITNASTTAGSGIVVTDTLPDTLRIDGVNVVQGQAAVGGQSVVYTLPALNPGETVQIEILTTVIRGPANGILINHAALTAQGPQGVVTKNAVAEVFVPTGLPATGYPPSEDLPGDGEPPVWMVGMIAALIVALAAMFVWARGRRWQHRNWYVRQG
ncbi:MAG: DUF11 domain-containing protein [Chloroflexi bacterium]|nr:DUF11 domain-containing protein [Chloroflexota bacterium]